MSPGPDIRNHMVAQTSALPAPYRGFGRVEVSLFPVWNDVVRTKV